MNKFLKITMLAAIPLWGLTSCLDDNKYAYFHPNESWGTIVGTPENFKIEPDNGNTLRVTENLDPSFPVEDSLRVVATFTPLEQTGENSFDIRVNAMKKLLTKMPVYLSELTPDEIDSLGTDPIDIENAWFGAGEYLNIEFIIFVNDPQKAHFLNLVVDEEKSTPEEVFVTLRHNAFKDETRQKGWGRVSFDIAGLVPAGKDQIKVTLQWTGYSGVPDSASGIFKLREQNSSFSVTRPAGSNDVRTKSVTIR